VLPLLELHSLAFLFIIGGILAFLALKTLSFINEEGEVSKEMAVAEMKTGFRSGLKNKINKETLFSILCSPVALENMIQKKIKRRFENKLISMRTWRKSMDHKKTA